MSKLETVLQLSPDDLVERGLEGPLPGGREMNVMENDDGERRQASQTVERRHPPGRDRGALDVW